MSFGLSRGGREAGPRRCSCCCPARSEPRRGLPRDEEDEPRRHRGPLIAGHRSRIGELPQAENREPNMREKVRVYRKRNNPVWYGWVYSIDGKRISFCTKCTDRRAAILAVKQRERETYSPRRSPANATAHNI